MIDTAIILAGGLGTRLRPLTDKIPKPLLPIQNKPIIEHLILNLKEHGIKHIILSIGYKAEQIQNYFQNGSKWNINITYSLETEPLGTGGAVRQAAQHLSKPFVLMWGDNLHDINITAMKKTFQETITPILMALTPRIDVENFGVAKIEHNRIITFIEKPPRDQAPSNLINTGIFIINPSIFQELPTGKFSLERDGFEKFAPLGKITPYIHHGQWLPTDTIEKYEYANKNFKLLKESKLKQ